ncbi:MAG: redoxin domain-containing protein, partial [Pseudomonadota bacterium]|nr:redoxin domain-containing protein [Pseudomonadota bacterium]
MNHILSNLLRLGLILLTTAGFSGLVSAELKVGDAAPKFALPGTDGQTHELTAADGSWVVVAWFPKA